MADNSNPISSGTKSPLDALTQATGQTATQDKKSKDRTQGIASQEEFLTLLIHQLQNQDPLDPMKSEEFAVQLAQFSSLEQLVQINQKLDEGGIGGSGAGSVGTMASFLGQQVVLKDPNVQISGGKGPGLSVMVPPGVQDVRVDLVDADGRVVGSKQVGALEAGKQSIALQDVRVPNGSYEPRVVAVDSSGAFVDLDTKVSGIVEGFVIEPDPALLVNGQQVKLEDIAEVYRPKS